MGFDLYGENPKNNAMEDDLNRREELDRLWEDNKITDEQKEEYYELQKQLRETNPGDYFRNNVWWWRQMWNFVCNVCEDVLTEEDMAGGSFNDNHLISEEKALAMADLLDVLIKDGTVDTIEKDVMAGVEKARIINEAISKEKEELREIVRKATGKEDIAPIDYPEDFRKLWDKLNDKEDWGGRYPFDKENVIQFSKFCRQSGGFRIC